MTFYLRLRSDELVALPRPAIMGVINVSPNSFYNPHKTVDEVVTAAKQMIASGVEIIDIGGEATNPNVVIQTERPSVDEELNRVLPALEAIRARFNVLISIDTSRSTVMRQAVELGADIINDQRALVEEGSLQTAAELKVPVCLMHFFKEARVPGSSSPAKLLQSIIDDLQLRIEACIKAGITQDRIIIDPGFGQGNYGKNCEENFYLLNKLNEFIKLGYPVLSGWSRKSMIGDTLGGRDRNDRLFGSIAADTLATYLGAHILRVHDVAAAKDAATVAARAYELATVEV